MLTELYNLNTTVGIMVKQLSNVIFYTTFITVLIGDEIIDVHVLS